MSAYDLLSNLERERVVSASLDAVALSFSAMHEATGWCGDVQQENWDAALLIIQEAMAVLVLSYRSDAKSPTAGGYRVDYSEPSEKAKEVDPEMKAFIERGRRADSQSAPAPYDAELGTITANDREYAIDMVSDLEIDDLEAQIDTAAQWIRKVRYEAVIADRKRRTDPKSLKAGEVPDDVVAALKESKMNERHNHLNALLDDKPGTP